MAGLLLFVTHGFLYGHFIMWQYDQVFYLLCIYYNCLAQIDGSTGYDQIHAESLISNKNDLVLLF